MKEEFVNFPSQNHDPHFLIDLAGISYCDGNYMIKRRRSDYIVVEYIEKGEGTVILDGKQYIAREGDIYLLPTGKDHMYYSDAQNPWQKLWFNAQGTLGEELLREYNPRNRVVYEAAGGREYFERIHEIGNSRLTAEQKNQRAALVFHELLQYLYDKYDRQESPYDKEMTVMKEYLDNHVTDIVPLKTLCGLVYLSEAQVIRIFKKNTGKTPHEYSLELKLSQGKRLLRNTNLRVQEIADYLGFCDAHYFSYLFGKKTGKTPLEYRKSG